MPLLTARLGPLDCRVYQESERPPRLGVVLCHGFGAPGDDLVSLAPELTRGNPALADVRFLFPSGPMTLDAYGYGGGRAWWMLDGASISQLSGNEASVVAARVDTPPGMAPARRQLHACIDAFCQASGLGLGKLVLGGFSQGAMVTTDLALRLDEPPAALAILSGTLLSETEWRKRAPSRAGLRVLQTHGTQDPLLPYFNAVALRDLLTGAGLQVEFHSFPGGHTIPHEALTGLARLLG